MTAEGAKRDAEAGRDAKRAVGVSAAAEVRSGMVVGLGTGSTAAWALREIGRRVRDEGLEVIGVPTSFSSGLLANEVGIPVRTLDQVEQLDLALDGADEVDPQRRLIKGGGAAHTQEKVVDGCAQRFLVLVDESKCVARLGEGFAVPLEVLPFALRPVTAAVRALGGEPRLRFGSGKDGPVISDLGHFVVDAAFGPIADPDGLAAALSSIPGVVEHGLFVGMADEVFVGTADGSVERR